MSGVDRRMLNLMPVFAGGAMLLCTKWGAQVHSGIATWRPSMSASIPPMKCAQKEQQLMLLSAIVECVAVVPRWMIGTFMLFLQGSHHPPIGHLPSTNVAIGQK